MLSNGVRVELRACSALRFPERVDILVRYLSWFVSPERHNSAGGSAQRDSHWLGNYYIGATAPRESTPIARLF